MKRKCDLCDREATVHEVTIQQGEKIEKHLCESCAREEGIVVQPDPSLPQLLTKFVISQGSPAQAEKPRGPHCEDCGLTFDEFRKTGLLGCPRCYTAFADQLTPLLERAHDGGTVHSGKVPQRAGGSVDRQELLAALRRQLDDAIESEEYERAAKIRDRINDAETLTKEHGARAHDD